MRFKNPYLTDIEKCNLLQRWLIVHSILYYERNESVVSDFVYDSNSKQLLTLMKKIPESELLKTRYWYVFKDFDGSTGFYFYKRLTGIDRDYLDREASIALFVNKRCKNE